MRQADDAAYAETCARIRVGKPVVSASEQFPVTDDRVLNSRSLDEIASRNPDEAAKFRNCPIIVADKQVRDAINTRVVSDLAKEAGVKVSYLCAGDRLRGREVERDL